MSHSPFTRVCHCIPRGYTCPFFNCHRCYIGRVDLFDIYFILSGDDDAAIRLRRVTASSSIARGSDLARHLGVCVFRQFQKFQILLR